MCSSRWIFYLTEFTGIQAASIQSGSWGLVHMSAGPIHHGGGLVFSWADRRTCILGSIRSYMWYSTLQRAGNWNASNDFSTWHTSGATSERAWICLVTDGNV